MYTFKETQADGGLPREVVVDCARRALREALGGDGAAMAAAEPRGEITGRALASIGRAQRTLRPRAETE
eukprot:14451076-Alexandrium_andersonii.AAC.1